jgi:glycosyltransferase involved in cell wall biosynthesis
VTELHMVVPDGVDDPARPSGGNTYDRRVRAGLAELGHAVRVHAVPGAWPHADRDAHAHLGRVLAGLADGAVVLLDGLVASAAPEVLVPQADRLRLVALVHMPLGLGPSANGARGREEAVLGAVRSVVATSRWSRRALIDLYGIAPERVHVAEPGADPAGIAPGTAAGGALLCVAAVIPGKGQDVLIEALAAVDGDWGCTFVGSLERDPDFVDRLRGRVRHHGLDERVRFEGPRAGAGLARSYLDADVLVLASHGETYGMVVTEALAAGLPVVATEVGGVPEALGRGAHGVRPGLLVPPADPGALAGALQAWLRDACLRRLLRRAARERRTQLPRWDATASTLAGVLAEAAG